MVPRNAPAALVLATLLQAVVFTPSSYAFSPAGISMRGMGFGGVTASLRSATFLRAPGALPTSTAPSFARLRHPLTTGLRMQEDSQGAGENAGEKSVEGAAEDDNLDLSSPEFLARKVEILEKELADAQQRLTELEADTQPLQDLVTRKLLVKPSAVELKDTYFRLAADFENFRRRSATDQENAKNSAMTSVLKELTTVLDNFELASGAVTTETDREASIKKSYEAINKQMVTALTKLGVEPIDPLGQDFDPNVHNAIQQMESNEYKEGVVCKALQRGYKVGSMVLRAAIVVVSSGPGPEGESPASETPSEKSE